MALDSRNVPEVLVGLLPDAERWGIGDDFERARALREASDTELRELVHSIDGISDEDLFGWLAGPESRNPAPTREYLALSCLIQAIESAKLKLAKRARSY